MADTNKTTRTLNVLIQGSNPNNILVAKTVAVKVPNPRTNLQRSDFTDEIETFFVDAARFSGKLDNSDSPQSLPYVMTGAYTENKSITELDLSGL